MKPSKTELAELEALVDAFNDARIDFEAKRQELHDRIAEIRDAAREAFDEKSERWQEGDKGSEVSAWIDALDDAESSLDEEAAPEIAFGDIEPGFG